MQTYLDDVKPIFIIKTRKSTSDDTVTGAGKTKLVSLVGQLAWIARESLLQIAFDVCDLRLFVSINPLHARHVRE